MYDMAYVADGETALVNAARAAGFGAASGRSMLVHQGAAAFALWTGLLPPGAVMGDALIRATAGSRSPAMG
jgi:shikimate dehydrogenase